MTAPSFNLLDTRLGDRVLDAAAISALLDQNPGVSVAAVFAEPPALGSTTPAAVSATTVDASGAITGAAAITGATVGYATGAGGAITQQTSRATGVTLDTVCGQITTSTASLAAAAHADFTVTCAAVAATDVVVANITSGGTGSPRVDVVGVAAGSFKLRVTNDHASTADTSADVINYAIIKAVAA